MCFLCSPPQEVLVGVRAGYRGRPDSRGAPGSFKCPMYSTDTLHPRLTSLAEDWLILLYCPVSWCKFTWALSVVLLDIVSCFKGVARGLRLCGWTEMPGCWGNREDNFWFYTFFLGETIFTRLYIGLLLRERERESARGTGGNRSGMLMLIIPLIRSDPHSDKGYNSTSNVTRHRHARKKLTLHYKKTSPTLQ
ncbi:hypothetical protein DPMN_102724 [Dreissena polymorpha]|uniref:Uncharacterized protein n=1 Tax=Dreissena polymorpha TaxID=45954 RepID=A0A9D4RA51_DREPO|nr:hypothetical protein DPMN_102724 [Dreissena polymorpha]